MLLCLARYARHGPFSTRSALLSSFSRTCVFNCRLNPNSGSTRDLARQPKRKPREKKIIFHEKVFRSFCLQLLFKMCTYLLKCFSYLFSLLIFPLCPNALAEHTHTQKHAIHIPYTRVSQNTQSARTKCANIKWNNKRRQKVNE